MKQAKRGLAALLAAVMLLGMLPAMAAEAGTVIEAEDTSPSYSEAWGIKELRTTDDAECGGGKFIFVQGASSEIGQWVDFTLRAPGDGDYDLYVTTKDNADRGIFQFTVNENPLGSPVDFYQAKADYAGQYGTYVEHNLGTVTQSGGSVTLRATLTGKSEAGAESKNYGGAFDCFRLVKASSPSEPGPTVLYETDFSTLPEGLDGVAGWEQVALREGYALKGTSPVGAGLLGDFTEAGRNLPDAYTLVVDLQLMASLNGSGYSGGLTFFKTDATHFYHYRENLSGTTSNVQLYQWPNTTNPIESVNITTGGEPHRLRVTVNGADMVCYMDGVKTQEYTVGASDGTLGLRIYNAEALFDDFTVYEGVVPPAESGEHAESFELPETGPKTYRMTLADEGVTKSTGWLSSSLHGSTADCTSVYGSTIGAYVKFQPKAMKAGWYEVSFWNIAKDQSAMKMKANVHTNGGDEEVQPPAMDTDGWNSVGVFHFDGTGDEYFQLTVAAAGPHSRVADVRFMETEEPSHESAVWHDEGKEFTAAGTWTAAVTPVGADGSGLHLTDERAATASWEDYPPATGRYTVYYWNPAAVQDETRAPLKFNLSSLDGNWRVSLNPNGKPEGWTKLCTIAATAGTAVNVTMSLAGPGTAYADAVKLEGTSMPADPVYTPGEGGSDEVAVLVNQIGYDTGKPKRATVPNVVDGEPFAVVSEQTHETVFSGTVVGGVADFSEMPEPRADADYHISCAGVDSYVFTVGENLIQRRSVKNALAFMAETRSDVFEKGVAGIGWRDSHQFSFELNGMALQYMANPALYDSLPYGIYKADTCEFEELRTQDEPDLVWLIEFAALRYYDWGHEKGRDLHMLTKEQLAYYLYLYPEISEYVSKETYEAIRDYTISVWGKNAVSSNAQFYPIPNTNHDLYSVQTVFGGLKGSQPPGHSIVPNLLMYEVAKRDGLGDDVAQRFFDAAYANCAYTIESVDITDPFYNKGQRMSEYITVPALSWFLEQYPTEAPAGLKAAIGAWADKTIARSDNLWDIRMAASLAAGDGSYAFHYTDGNIDKDYWTGAAYAAADKQASVLPGGTPKNEPGNQAGLQAVAYAAARVLDDPAVDERLVELGVAAIDDLYGRNPTRLAAFYDFTRDFVGADKGWYKQYTGGNGVLGRHTAVIDANAPELCYPYAPENYNTGYTEGWVAYNTAWNASLAYAAADAVSLSADPSGAVGTQVSITLTAPLNMDPASQETGCVYVADPLAGTRTKLTVTEQGTDSSTFKGTCVLPNTPYVTVSYGSGLFRQSADITVSDFAGKPATGLTLDNETLTLSTGETARLTATVVPADATDKRAAFTSDNPAVATVTADGLVKAVGAGSAVITAASVSDPQVRADCVVTVAAAAPRSLQVSAPSTMSAFGAPGKIEVTGVVYSDGTVKTDNLPVAAFSTENAQVLTVAADGVLTAHAAGTAAITASATVEGKLITGSATVTVTADLSYDFLTLYRANAYTAKGVTMAIAAGTSDSLTGSYGKDRLKLTGNAAGNTLSFPLGRLSAGTYGVTLFSKYYGDKYPYGTWSFMVDGEAVGREINFNQADKNGNYYDIPLGNVELTEGEHSFVFVSSDGGTLVPVSVTLTLGGLEEPDPGPGPDEPGPGQTEPKIHTMDEMYKKVYTDAAIQAGGLNYRLYVPAGYEHSQAEKLPLLIYLNGAGSRGTDNEKQLANLSPLITPLIDDPEHPCIIVVPQLPTTDKWVNVDWTQGSYDADVAESNSAKLLMGLIDELKTAYKVDSDRVYLMGQSFGGYGTWDLITRHPETFAAAVPMCGSACLARAESVKEMPLLVLHGSADPTVPVSGSQEMVAALKAAGSSTVAYLEYEGDDHYVQRRLFEQPELYLDWLFSQRKGTPPTTPNTDGLYMPKRTLNLNSAAQLNQLTVTGGTAAISGEQLVLTPESGSASALALVKDTENFRDGQLTAHFTMAALTTSGGAGLVLRAQDDQNFVHLRFTKDGLQLLEMVNGASVRSSTKSYTLTGGRITCLKAEVKGSALKVWVDNVLLFDTTIQTPALQAKGGVGVRSYAVPAKVDDIIWAARSGAYIELASMADRQVYQRNVSTGDGAVTLSGVAEGAAKLRFRVVSWDDGSSVILDWTETPINGDGGFSASLTVPQGGWYKTQLESLDDEGKTIARTESGRWGVGINILCIGQSNMVGIGQGTPEAADDLASNFMNERWTHLEDPYDKGDTTPISSDGTVGNSMVPSLANSLIAEYGLPVGIIPAAKGGAGLVCDCADYPRWLDRTEHNPADRGNLYGNSLYRAQAAGGVELILMNQGEHDVSGNTTEEAYLAAMRTLLANYRQDLGWDVPFFYCQLGPAKPSSWGAEKNAVMDGIRAAQMRANDPEHGMILAAVEMDLDRNSDNLHYTTESQKVIGRRVANAIVWYYDEAADKADYYTGPSIASVLLADGTGEKLDVKLVHGGGSDFTPAEGVTGFTVVDGSGSIAINSAVRTSADTITLTLARPIVGSAKVRYMAGLLPDVSGIIKDNSALTLPLNATAGWLTVNATEPDPDPELPAYTGGGSTATKTERNDDGSTTKTVTDKKTGLTTATTTWPDGSKVVAKTAADGSVTAQVTLPDGNTAAVLTIPTTAKLGLGAVAILVRPDGTEELLKTSIATEKGLRVSVSEGGTIKLLDNTKHFTDMPDESWVVDSVVFVSARELFLGTGENTFSSEEKMTRAMAVTVLARLAGQDTGGGEIWYKAGADWAVETGVSDGSALEQDVSLEQLFTMLYRYEGSPEVNTDLLDPSVPEYARRAMAWAAEIGLTEELRGKSDPKSTVTRAEAAAILKKYISEILK